MEDETSTWKESKDLEMILLLDSNSTINFFDLF